MSSLVVEVCEVKKVETHPNADRLELAMVKGWQTIIGKGDHQVGDLVIFVPPDSILPENLIKRFNITYLKGKNGRVGVVKLRGVFSYGLILPNEDSHRLGTNVADIYGIIKWEPPSEVHTVGGRRSRNQKGNPNFFKYTDIENYRNFEDVLREGERVVITEKIHGTNLRLGWVEKPIGNLHKFIRNLFKLGPVYEFIVGSRNVQYNYYRDITYYGINIYILMSVRLGLTRLPKGYTVYGEIYGPSIQDLTYSAQKLGVVFFDVMWKGRYLDYTDARMFFSRQELPTVPMLYAGPWSYEKGQELVTGLSKMDNKTIREGIVIRPVHERVDPKLGRVIVKLINPDYLVRKGASENK